MTNVRTEVNNGSQFANHKGGDMANGCIVCGVNNSRLDWKQNHSYIGIQDKFIDSVTINGREIELREYESVCNKCALQLEIRDLLRELGCTMGVR